VHIVVEGDATPESMMTTFKSYATRALNSKYPDHAERLRWARHGSTRHLFTKEAFENAINYTLNAQGAPMATFERPSLHRAATVRERTDDITLLESEH
jgi:hypothetical protein